MQAIAIIPARLGSTRFPGKVLASETGKPLIQHVYENARRAGGGGGACLSRIVVATDDRRVLDAVLAFGGEAVLTSPAHPNGTSRLAEAAAVLQLADDQIVVNVQGDEPELAPAAIEGAVRALDGCDVGTTAVPITNAAEFTNPNVVKVVLRPDSSALYFSRAPIPHDRDGGENPSKWSALKAEGLSPSVRAHSPLRHLGIYAYSVRFLRAYAALPETPLEQREKLEQLRVLEHGCRIGVAIVNDAGGTGIDTPEQYAAFVRRYLS